MSYVQYEDRPQQPSPPSKPMGCGKFGCIVLLLLIGGLWWLGRQPESPKEPDLKFEYRAEPGPTPARVPKPPTGALGMNKPEADSSFGSSTPEGDAHTYWQGTFYFNFLSGSHVEYKFPSPVHYKQAMIKARELLPQDHKISREDVQSEPYNRTVVHGRSKWLGSRYPKTGGKFIVIVRQSEGRNNVTSIVLADGDNP